MTTVHSNAGFLAADDADLPLADRLRQAMKDHGMTQVEVARRLSGPRASERTVDSKRRLLNKWLGGTKPGGTNAAKLSEIFDKPADYFLEARRRSTRSLSEISELAIEATRDVNRVDLPDVLDRDVIADELILGFKKENILITVVDDWQELEHAAGLAELGPTSLRLDEWYNGSTIVPGLVLFELLNQIASVALLTDPVYRQRMVYVGSVNHFRIRKIVRATENQPARLRIEARLAGLVDNGRIAQYLTTARFEDSHELVARAEVTISTTR